MPYFAPTGGGVSPIIWIVVAILALFAIATLLAAWFPRPTAEGKAAERWRKATPAERDAIVCATMHAR